MAVIYSVPTHTTHWPGGLSESNQQDLKYSIKVDYGKDCAADSRKWSAVMSNLNVENKDDFRRIKYFEK